MDLAQISQVDNALLQACLEGNEDALAHAVRHGALATRARDAMGATPLHMACLGGHLDIAAWCADQGLEVTTADAQGALPLHTACFNGHLDVARWLTTKAKTSRKEALNQPDLQGGTPLHHAALGGSLKLCRWLLFHGADERATTVDGLTPERVAMEAGEGSQKIVTLLRCHATHLQATEPDRPPFSVAKAAPAEPTAADAAVDADELEAVAQAEREAEAFRRDETARLLAEEDARRQAQEVAAAKLVATQVEAAEQAQKACARGHEARRRRLAAPVPGRPGQEGGRAPRRHRHNRRRRPLPRRRRRRATCRAPAVVPFSNADEAPVQEAPAPKPSRSLMMMSLHKLSRRRSPRRRARGHRSRRARPSRSQSARPPRRRGAGARRRRRRRPGPCGRNELAAAASAATPLSRPRDPPYQDRVGVVAPRRATATAGAWRRRDRRGAGRADRSTRGAGRRAPARAANLLSPARAPWPSMLPNRRGRETGGRQLEERSRALAASAHVGVTPRAAEARSGGG